MGLLILNLRVLCDFAFYPTRTQDVVNRNTWSRWSAIFEEDVSPFHASQRIKTTFHKLFFVSFANSQSVNPGMLHHVGLAFCVFLTFHLIVATPSTAKVTSDHMGLQNSVHPSKNSTAPHDNATSEDDEEEDDDHSNGHWAYYSSKGIHPDQWANMFPACRKNRQSPVEINIKSSLLDKNLTALRLVDYDDSPLNDRWTITNNGHTVQLSGQFVSAPQLQGGGLPGKYIFQQLHFHWGANNSAGSEHVIDGKYYPLEVHLVHRRKNETDDEAANDEVGLAVLGIMFEITKDSSQVSPLVKTFIAEVQKVSKPETRVNSTIPSFSLFDLCPKNLSYVRYLGSLTTPPCLEAVVWTVLTTPQKITEDLLVILRNVWARISPRSTKELHGTHMVNNYRPLQPLNDRVIHRYIDNSAENMNFVQLTDPNKKKDKEEDGDAKAELFKPIRFKSEPVRQNMVSASKLVANKPTSNSVMNISNPSFLFAVTAFIFSFSIF